MNPTLGDKPQAGHHFLLVHVETGTALMQCFHAHLPQEAAGVKPSRQEVYLTCSRTDADLSWPATVPGDNNGCSKGLRSNSVTGSLTPRQNQSRCRPHHHNRFIQPGAPREWELSWLHYFVNELTVPLSDVRRYVTGCRLILRRMIRLKSQAHQLREALGLGLVHDPSPVDLNRAVADPKLARDLL